MPQHNSVQQGCQMKTENTPLAKKNNVVVKTEEAPLLGHTKSASGNATAHAIQSVALTDSKPRLNWAHYF